jgi:hypothetical protein
MLAPIAPAANVSIRRVKESGSNIAARIADSRLGRVGFWLLSLGQAHRSCRRWICIALPILPVAGSVSPYLVIRQVHRGIYEDYGFS